jgi:3-deoxy-D-manno-octulosonic-acid transferase
LLPHLFRIIVSEYNSTSGTSFSESFGTTSEIPLSKATKVHVHETSVSELSKLPALVKRLHADFADQMIDTFREAGPLLFDDRVRSQILRNYEFSNEWVRAQWFPSRSTLFEPAGLGSARGVHSG